MKHIRTIIYLVGAALIFAIISYALLWCGDAMEAKGWPSAQDNEANYLRMKNTIINSGIKIPVHCNRKTVREMYYFVESSKLHKAKT
jgi:hypothetical protein